MKEIEELLEELDYELNKRDIIFIKAYISLKKLEQEEKEEKDYLK